MKYYLHDSNSFSDEKITELYIAFGYEGLGLFYTLLEKLAQQEKPIKTSVLKAQLKVGKKLDKIWNFMEEIGLIYSNNGDTFNEQLLKFSEKYTIKKEKNAKRISEWRKKQEVTENVTCNESVRNTRKVKISKYKKSKDKYKRISLSQIKISDFENINPDYYEIAVSFQNLFRENLKQSGASTKTVDRMKGGAIDDIRLTIESDGYTVEDLRKVYKFLQVDDFWKTNILSIPKLRKQMAQLKLKMANNGKTKRDYKEGTTYEELAAVIQSKFTTES